MLVPEGVAEGHLGQRRATARVVDDVGDDALEVPIALAEVEGAEAGGALAVVGVGLEHGARTLTLRADHTTHLGVDGEGGAAAAAAAGGEMRKWARLGLENGEGPGLYSHRRGVWGGITLVRTVEMEGEGWHRPLDSFRQAVGLRVNVIRVRHVSEEWAVFHAARVGNQWAGFHAKPY